MDTFCSRGVEEPRLYECGDAMLSCAGIFKERLAALKAKENRCHIAQQLKPAMPSFEILWSRIEEQYAALGFSFENYCLAAVKDGARDMYKLVTAGV
jgi:hypothetical protein